MYPGGAGTRCMSNIRQAKLSSSWKTQSAPSPLGPLFFGHSHGSKLQTCSSCCGASPLAKSKDAGKRATHSNQFHDPHVCMVTNTYAAKPWQSRGVIGSSCSGWVKGVPPSCVARARLGAALFGAASSTGWLDPCGGVVTKSHTIDPSSITTNTYVLLRACTYNCARLRPCSHASSCTLPLGLFLHACPLRGCRIYFFSSSTPHLPPRLPFPRPRRIAAGTFTVRCHHSLWWRHCKTKCARVWPY